MGCLYPRVVRHENVDVKQTSYKKLAKFLHAMAQKGVVTVRDKKGRITVLSTDLVRHIDVTCVSILLHFLLIEIAASMMDFL